MCERQKLIFLLLLRLNVKYCQNKKSSSLPYELFHTSLKENGISTLPDLSIYIFPFSVVEIKVQLKTIANSGLRIRLNTDVFLYFLNSG